MNDWISLHNHFVYSKLDSMLQVNEAVKRAKQYGMNALAITDHGLVVGIPDFYKACKKEGIKAILGTEIYLTEDHRIKSREEMRLLGHEVYHLILYAKNDKGLSNLYQIASRAGNEGLFDGYERIDIPFIKKNKLGEGIIATSACLGGPVASWLLDKKHRSADKSKAVTWADVLNDTFEHFYIELGCNSLPEQHYVNAELQAIASQLNIPIVISGDTHYLDKSDAKIHEILLCMNTGSTLSDPDHFKFPSEDYYLLHPDEVLDFCKQHNIPQCAIDNTRLIADMCTADPTPKTKKGLFPQFPTPKGYTSENYLQKKAYDNLLIKSMNKPIDYIQYSKRTAYELEVINMKGYADYFLILWDLIEWCKSVGIMTGPGRGSAAGAVVSYELGITKLDPIEHDLLFERFLNPDKDAFPDIDTDFEYLRRQEVIEYILKKYGKENVSQILTQTKLRLKSGIRGIMKVLGYTLKEEDEMAKCVPDKFPDQSDVEYEKMKDILVNPDKYRQDFGDDKFRNVEIKVKAFWEKMKNYPDVNTALEKLEGCISAYGVHPSGVVITNPGALKLNLPTRYFDSAPLPVCQFDMEGLDFCKALKLDILGLKNLSIVDIACSLAGISKTVLDREDFDSDPEIYEMLREGLTKHIFQLSSPGMTKMIQDIHIESFAELTDALALYRPGPLGAKDSSTGLTMVETYIQNKRNNVVTSLHKSLDKMLSATKGCLVYQEQVMKTGQIISGYTLGRSDEKIRKPVGKKKIKEFPEIRKEFVYGSADAKCNNCGKKGIFNLPDTSGNLNCPECNTQMVINEIVVPGAIRLGHAESFANSMFDMILKFGGYGFNKCLAGSERIMRGTNNGSIGPTIEEMYLVKNDKDYAIKNNKDSLHRRYNKNGYGKAMSMYENGRIKTNDIVDITPSGYRQVYKVTLESGQSVKCTDNHKFPTPDGVKELLQLKVGDELYTVGSRAFSKSGSREQLSVLRKIKSIEYSGMEETYDIEMAAPNHNFASESGIIVSNSHSACYAVIAWMTAWLKYYYPVEFLCAVMTVHCNDQDELIESIIECKKLGIDILPPDINKSKERFSIETLPDGKRAIRYGFTGIKGIGQAPAEEIVKYQPYASITDYMAKTHDPSINRRNPDGTKINNPLSKRNEPVLIFAGCFDELEENRHKVYNQYCTIRKDKNFVPMNEKKYDRKIKLEYEKEYMGMYISDHPLKNYPYIRWTEIDDGDLIQIGGILRKIEEKPGKFGTYCTGTIETLEDKRRFIAYDKVYAAYKEKLKVGVRIVLEGKKNEEFSNIKVDRILFAIPRKKLINNQSIDVVNLTEEELGGMVDG